MHYIFDFIPPQEENQTRISLFFHNLKSGRFTTTYCPSCRLYMWQPRVVCPRCLSEKLEWRELPKKGRIYAFSKFNAICIGLVELEGGIKILSGIEGDYEKLCVGQEVFLKIMHLEDGRIFFYFASTL